MPPPVTTGAPHPARPRGPRRGLAIAAIVIGPLLIGLGLLVMASPYALFLLGGGGDTEAFGAFAAGFLVPGIVIAAIGVALLVLGIVGLVRARR